MPIEQSDIVRSPANGPGPVTRMNMRPYTNAGIVRMAAITVRPMSAIGFGTRLLAERNASGSEMTAPTIVPRNAMQNVSSSRYGTPFVPSVKRSFPDGWKMPERMFPATARPLPVGLLTRTALPDHASRHATMNAARSCRIHVFGADS